MTRTPYTDDDYRAGEAMLSDVLPDAPRSPLDAEDYGEEMPNDDRPWLGKVILAALILYAIIGAVGYWLVMP